VQCAHSIVGDGVDVNCRLIAHTFIINDSGRTGVLQLPPPVEIRR